MSVEKRQHYKIFWYNEIPAYIKTIITMAIALKDINTENIRFKEPTRHMFGNVEYHRVPIQYLNDDFVIMTNTVRSYGIKENRASSVPGAKDGPIESYSLPIVIGDSEKNVIESIVELCRNHICTKPVYSAVKKKIWEKYPPHIPIPFFYQKDEDGNDIGQATMYPKLMTLYKKVKDGEPPVITTAFYEYIDGEAKDIQPTELMDSSCLSGVAALHLKDIYIGANPSLQFRVTDFIVESREYGFNRKRLLNVYKPPDTSCVINNSSNTDTVNDESSSQVSMIRRRQQL